MLEILKYTLPALIVLFATWLVLYKLLKNESDKRLWELKRLSQKEITPIRLRAYERLALVLERTTPEYMIANLDINNLSIEQMKQAMLRTVRMEFEHNMSQQIYVSDRLWQQILLARDQMGAFLTAMSTQIPTDGNSIAYARTIIAAYNSNGDTPHKIALETLKNEVEHLF